MEGDLDDIIAKFRAQPKNQQSQCIDALNRHFVEFSESVFPVELACVLVQLSKSMSAIKAILYYQPAVSHHFPILKANHRHLPYFTAYDDFYKKRGQSLEQFVFHALIFRHENSLVSFLMRRFGLSAAGTDDQYYNWVTDLERRARCYRAVATLLGIARFRRPPVWQRDTLQMVAKALWSTRCELEWFLLD